QKLKEAIPLITILVAGADGKIDTKEREWAEKVTSIRTYKTEPFLLDFYKEVGTDFTEKLDDWIENLPNHIGERNGVISERLSAINPILKILPLQEAAAIYSDLISFAKHVAKASGGFFGFFSIGPEEGKVIGLPMLDEYIYIPEEEEPEEFEDPLQ
ncbi:MAG: hypothetical protein AAGK97_15440, partial [Bacteroidota bacterium]